MQAGLRRFLIISAKNAVNAAITNSALMLKWQQTFHLHSWDGIKNVLWATLIVVGTREGIFWGAKLLAWSQSPTNGSGKADAHAAGS